MIRLAKISGGKTKRRASVPNPPPAERSIPEAFRGTRRKPWAVVVVLGGGGALLRLVHRRLFSREFIIISVIMLIIILGIMAAVIGDFSLNHPFSFHLVNWLSLHVIFLSLLFLPQPPSPPIFFPIHLLSFTSHSLSSPLSASTPSRDLSSFSLSLSFISPSLLPLQAPPNPR